VNSSVLIPEREDRRYTYSETLTWNDNVWYELIDGRPKAMTAPLISHQRITRKLIVSVDNFLAGKKCELFHAPSDVHLNEYDVFQPDLYVVCDKSKLFERGCKGAPDLVIEVLSPSTTHRDIRHKYRKYESAGVSEYWIVDPIDKTIDVYLLVNGKYNHTEYNENDVLVCNVLSGFQINIADVFGE
jgi:Uma2 family endonuclease